MLIQLTTAQEKNTTIETNVTLDEAVVASGHMVAGLYPSKTSSHAQEPDITSSHNILASMASSLHYQRTTQNESIAPPTTSSILQSFDAEKADNKDSGLLDSISELRQGAILDFLVPLSSFDFVVPSKYLHQYDTSDLDVVSQSESYIRTADLNSVSHVESFSSEQNTIPYMDSSIISTELNIVTHMNSSVVSTKLKTVPHMDSSIISTERNIVPYLSSPVISTKLNTVPHMDSLLISTERNIVPHLSSPVISTELNTVPHINSSVISSELNTVPHINSSAISTELNIVPHMDSSVISTELNTVPHVGSSLISSELNTVPHINSSVISSELNIVPHLDSSVISTELNSVPHMDSSVISTELNIVPQISASVTSTELNIVPHMDSLEISTEMITVPHMSSAVISTKLNFMPHMDSSVISTELNPIPSMASSVLSTELHMVQQNDSSHSYMVPNLTSVTKTLDRSVILGTSVFSDSQLTHSQEHATPQIHVSSIESSDSLMRTVDTIFYSLVSSIEPIPTLTSEQPVPSVEQSDTITSIQTVQSIEDDIFISKSDFSSSTTEHYRESTNNVDAQSSSSIYVLTSSLPDTYSTSMLLEVSFSSSIPEVPLITDAHSLHETSSKMDASFTPSLHETSTKIASHRVTASAISEPDVIFVSSFTLNLTEASTIQSNVSIFGMSSALHDASLTSATSHLFTPRGTFSSSIISSEISLKQSKDETYLISSNYDALSTGSTPQSTIVPSLTSNVYETILRQSEQSSMTFSNNKEHIIFDEEKTSINPNVSNETSQFIVSHSAFTSNIFDTSLISSVAMESPTEIIHVTLSDYLPNSEIKEAETLFPSESMASSKIFDTSLIASVTKGSQTEPITGALSTSLPNSNVKEVEVVLGANKSIASLEVEAVLGTSKSIASSKINIVESILTSNAAEASLIENVSLSSTMTKVPVQSSNQITSTESLYSTHAPLSTLATSKGSSDELQSSEIVSVASSFRLSKSVHSSQIFTFPSIPLVELGGISSSFHMSPSQSHQSDIFIAESGIVDVQSKSVAGQSSHVPKSDVINATIATPYPSTIGIDGTIMQSRTNTLAVTFETIQSSYNDFTISSSTQLPHNSVVTAVLGLSAAPISSAEKNDTNYSEILRTETIVLKASPVIEGNQIMYNSISPSVTISESPSNIETFTQSTVPELARQVAASEIVLPNTLIELSTFDTEVKTPEPETIVSTIKTHESSIELSEMTSKLAIVSSVISQPDTLLNSTTTTSVIENKTFVFTVTGSDSESTSAIITPSRSVSMDSSIDNILSIEYEYVTSSFSMTSLVQSEPDVSFMSNTPAILPTSSQSSFTSNTPTILPTSSQSFATAMDEMSASIVIPAISQSRTFFNLTTSESTFSNMSAEEIEKVVLTMPDADMSDTFKSSRSVSVDSSIDGILSIEYEYLMSSFVTSKSQSEPDILLTSSTPAILATSSQSFATTQPHIMLNFTTSESTFSNMSATEIEKLVLAMPDADSENVSDNLKSSMSGSVLSSIDNASIEHDYITPSFMSSLSQSELDFLLTSSTPAILPTSSQSFATTQPHTMLHFTTSESTFSNMSAEEIDKLVLTMPDVDSENVSDIFNSSSSVAVGSSIDDNLSIKHDYVTPSFMTSKSQSEPDFLLTSRTPAILATSSQSFATTQPHTMLNFTTSESTFSNMSATEIEKLVLAMPDADSENVSDNLKSSMSVSVLSSIDNASIEHDYITPLLVSSLSQSEPDILLTSSTPAILPTSSQSFATAQPHIMLNFTTSESTFSNMSAEEIEKLVLTMPDVDSENVSDIFNSSSSVSVGSSIDDNLSIKHDYITPSFMTSKSQSELDLLLTSSAPAILATSSQSFATAQPHIMLNFTTSESTFSNMSATEIEKLVLAMSDADSANVSDNLKSSMSVSVGSIIDNASIEHDYITPSFMSSLSQSEPDILLTSSTPAILATSSQSFATAQPHTMLNFTTFESTFSNMSATEIEKLVLAMPDADSENVSDNLKSSMSVSVLSSIDNASIEHDYITPLLVSSLSQSEPDILLTSSTPAILPTSSQSFATAQPHTMLNFTTFESTFSNMSATEIEKLVLTMPDVDSENVTDIFNSSSSVSVGSSIDDNLSIKHDYITPSFMTSKSQSELDLLLTSSTSAILSTSSQSFATAQPHIMLNFTTSESTFSNMSATEIEKLVLAMSDADSENVSDNLKSSMSVSVGSSIDNASIEHDYITPSLVSLLSQSEPDILLTSSTPAILATSSQSFATAQPHTMLNFTTSESTFSNMSATEIEKLVLAMSDADSENVSDIFNSSSSVSVGSSIDDNLSIEHAYITPSFMSSLSQSEPDILLTSSTPAILPTSSQSSATAQPHTMLNFTTSESTFSNMSATEIEKLVLAMPDADSENVSNIFKPSMSVSVDSSIDYILSIEHAYITPSFMSSLSQLEPDRLLTSITPAILPTSSQSFSTAISQSSVSVRIPAMSLSQTTLDSTTTSELSAKSAKGIETSVFVVTGSDSQDITPSRPIGVRSNIDDIFPLTLENEYVTSSFAITSELSQSDLLFLFNPSAPTILPLNTDDTSTASTNVTSGLESLFLSSITTPPLLSTSTLDVVPSHLSTLYLTLRECKFIFNHIINFDKIMFARVAQ